MSPQAGELLVQQIAPRIRSSVARSMSQVGSDDIEELVQDAIATAAKLLHSVEVRGKAVTPGNLAYFAVRLTGKGRRSTGDRSNDVMHPAARIQGRSTVVSLDATLTREGDGEETTSLHDSLACRTEDPALAALRHLDWQQVLAALDSNGREVLVCMAKEEDLTTLVPKLKRSRSWIQGIKEQLARVVREHLGDDILSQVQEQPRWTDSIQASQEKLACRYERQPA